jgi:hypothetical protein
MVKGWVVTRLSQEAEVWVVLRAQLLAEAVLMAKDRHMSMPTTMAYATIWKQLPAKNNSLPHENFKKRPSPVSFFVTPLLPIVYCLLPVQILPLSFIL